jgi:Holliday junction resolvase
MATEQQIQSKRIKQLEKEGYYVIKIIKANKNGLPDILALHPDKGALFCEVKTDKGVLSELQKFRLKELYEHGFKVEVLRGDRISSYPFESI